jgi:hypothetical protein
LGDGRWLATHAIEAQDQARNYTIHAQWPVVEGVVTPQAEQFNLAVQTLVSDTLTGFQQMITEPLLGQGGSIYVNYQVWNFDFNGLLIKFDPYQVMPYAYGPQTVAIPYRELQADLKPDSPLADFWNLTNR